MNNLLAQQTISEIDDEGISSMDYAVNPQIRNEKTSDLEGILSAKEGLDIIDMPYSHESQVQSKIALSEIKRMNREITRRIPNEEVESLFNEHNFLVTKKFREGISKQEEKRLTLIRWELDRIEDAIYGENIDRFESFLDGYERFAKDINQFVDNIRNSTKNRGKRR